MEVPRASWRLEDKGIEASWINQWFLGAVAEAQRRGGVGGHEIC